MTIKALLFDKDGTLFDFEKSWGNWTMSMLDLLSKGDAQRRLKLSEAMGFDPKTRQFQRGSVLIAGTVKDLIEAVLPYTSLKANALETLLNEEAAMAEQVEAVPLRPLLTLLQERGLKLGIATNDAEQGAHAHLAAAKITGHFDFVAGYDSGFGAKPDPGPCLAFATACGIAPQHIAMVGDSRHDLKAGRAAGMVTVAVLTGPALADELAPFADVVLPDIGHIPDWLDQE